MFGEYTPLMKPTILAKRLRSGRARIDPEMGLEKLCGRCEEFWPQDTLFWSICQNAASADGLQNYCKGCEAEVARLKRERKSA
jgi:hypothetical protein